MTWVRIFPTTFKYWSNAECTAYPPLSLSFCLIRWRLTTKWVSKTYVWRCVSFWYKICIQVVGQLFTHLLVQEMSVQRPQAFTQSKNGCQSLWMFSVANEKMGVTCEIGKEGPRILGFEHLFLLITETKLGKGKMLVGIMNIMKKMDEKNLCMLVKSGGE